MQFIFVYLQIENKNIHKAVAAISVHRCRSRRKVYDVSGIFNSFSTQRDILFSMEKSFIFESLFSSLLASS